MSLSCGSTPPSDGQPVTRQVITADGGQASIAGGRFKILIPKDALTRDTAITIQQVDAPAVGAVGPVYEVGPTGTIFQRPATLSFSFTSLNVGGSDVYNLHVATLSGGQWVPVASNVDQVAGVVTGQITHLSPWTLIVYAGPAEPEPDAGTIDQPDASDAAAGQGDADGGARDAGGGAGAGGQGGGAGTTGQAGTSGGAGTTGQAGTGGASGTSGGAGTTGQAGTSGGAGTTGQAGTSGGAGTTGQAGTSGGAGTTGEAGTTGTAGSGAAGDSGSSGAGGSQPTAGDDAGASDADAV